MTAEERLKICEACPIVKIDPTYGPICDNTKGIDPKTNEVSRLPRIGGVKGCSCKLRWKTKNPTSHCVAGFG